MSTSQLVISSGVTLMAPALWAALGELVNERSGTINLGIEGVMIIAAFTAAAVFQNGGGTYAAIAVAAGSGLLCALILGVLYIRLARDQIITGIVFDGVALGIAAVLTQKYLSSTHAATLHSVAIPGLSAIPWLGPVLFDHNLLVYGALVAAPCIYYLMHRTWFGLHARAAGERPLVIESAGLSVRWLRFNALVIGCTLTAIGGATLVLSTASTFQPGVTNGRGYIALAIVVMARWSPLGAILGAFLFGTAQAFQFQAGSVPVISHLPYDVVLMLPYLVVVCVVLLVRGARYPAAVGVPYRPRAERGAEE